MKCERKAVKNIFLSYMLAVLLEKCSYSILVGLLKVFEES